MRDSFRDRTEAGRLLARELMDYANRPDVLVLGLPRGGVPVAFEVARALHVPMDVFVVRKLGLPGHRELAMGAIASGGIRVLNDEVVNGLNLRRETIESVAAEEEEELRRRERTFRGHNVPPTIREKTIILVDDGVATGSTMRAAIRAIQQQQPARLIVAVPTAPPSTCRELRSEADEVIALMTPRDFYAVGQWYDNFSQTTDDEVSRLLEESRHATV